MSIPCFLREPGGGKTNYILEEAIRLIPSSNKYHAACYAIKTTGMFDSSNATAHV